MAQARRNPLWLAAAAVVAAVGLGWPAAWKNYERSLGPLDTAPARQWSAIAVDRNGELLRPFTTPGGRWRLPATTRDVDPQFIAMLLSYEDRRFFEHDGVDWRAMARALIQYARNGRVVSGGSTLTMQVARLLEPQPVRTIAAKLRQIARAFALEQRYGKEQILDLYLALAPYGGNLEGARAASLAYFGKEPTRLSRAEQALLVALPQSPETRRPDRRPQAARLARDRVLERAHASGLIPEAEMRRAMGETSPVARRPFPALAAHSTGRAHRAARTGERAFRFSYDRRLQGELERLTLEHARRIGAPVSGAMLVIDNRDGHILARVGSPDYMSTERGGANDMTQALRSPGSALKPFIYALAFEYGLAHPETVLEDRRTRYGLYAPENFDLAFHGQVTARIALQHSLNIPAVSLLDAVGPPRFLARLRNAGVEVAIPDQAPAGLALALGGLGTTLEDAARLFSGLARAGVMPDLIERLDGARQAPAPERRISTTVASWYVSDILLGAPPPDSAPAGRIAFKTGTSYGHRDAFAIGFDRAHTVAVWFGRPDNGAVPGLVAREAAAPALFEAFARIGGKRETAPRPPEAIVARSRNLPPPLRHLRKDAPKVISATRTGALQIAYPPDGARIALGFAPDGAPKEPLALKVEGGVAPFRWIVNGNPVGDPQLRRQSRWSPDGPGFARVSVMDARGQGASVRVRLE